MTVRIISACVRKSSCVQGVVPFGHWKTSLETFINVLGIAVCAVFKQICGFPVHPPPPPR